MDTRTHPDAQYYHPGSLNTGPRLYPPCLHPEMLVHPSPHSATTGSGYKHLDVATRYEAAGSASSVTPRHVFAYSSTFPGPLVLPGDALLGTDNTPQSLSDWADYMLRLNSDPSEIRKTIYIIEPPSFTPETENYMAGWERPQLQEHQRNAHGWPRDKDFTHHATCRLTVYLEAFYYGIEVALISGAWEWVPFHGQEAATSVSTQEQETYEDLGSEDWPHRIGLRHRQTGYIYCVRHRPSRDRIARQQFNSDDVGEAMKKELPHDAYAAVMILNHDICKNGWNDGNPGWATVGKGTSVVSTFRLRPALDTYNHLMVDGQAGHEWPLSHCSNYVLQECAEAQSTGCSAFPSLASGYMFRRPFTPVPVDETTPLGAAIIASQRHGQRTDEQWSNQFFFRVASVACHEVGHLLGMGHCPYFACNMQVAGENPELFRCPPYLCPVCLQKMVVLLSHRFFPHGTSVIGIPITPPPPLQRQWVRERYQALIKVCRNYGHGSMLEAYEVWLYKRLDQISE